MINRIEKNILSSADYVERGQEHVKVALENQKKARKVSLRPSPRHPSPWVALPPLLSFPDTHPPTPLPLPQKKVFIAICLSITVLILVVIIVFSLI